MASPYWFYLSDNEEIGDLPVQDHQHTQRRDILDAETEEIIDPRAVLAVEEDLLPQGIRLQLPADHQAHEQRPQGHQQALGHAVEQTQPAGAPAGQLGAGQTQQLRRGDVIAAHTVGADQSAQGRTDHHRNGGIQLAAVALALFPCLIAEMGHDDLQHGDGGGDGGKEHQQVKQDAEHGTGGSHLIEHVLHGDKQQLRAAQSSVGVQGKASGNDTQTGHQGHHGIHAHDDHGALAQILLLVQIGAVGNHDTGAQRQGEEHLPAGGCENLPEAGGLVDDAVGHGPAGDEHILQAVRRTRQGAGADDADDEDEEQGRHPYGADPLDAAAYAAHDHQHGDEHEGQCKGDGHVGLAQQPLKHVGAAHPIGAEFGADEVAEVHHHIAQTVAAQSAVKAEDQRRSGNTQPAQPLEALG